MFVEVGWTIISGSNAKSDPSYKHDGYTSNNITSKPVIIIFLDALENISYLVDGLQNEADVGVSLRRSPLNYFNVHSHDNISKTSWSGKDQDEPGQIY